MISESTVRRVHWFSALAAGVIVVFAALVFVLRLFSTLAIGSVEIDELSAYLVATGGAAFIVVAWLSVLVARRPQLSSTLSFPIAAGWFGMALVRYLTLFFSQDLAALLGPALIAEVISFSMLGMLVGSSRVDALFSMAELGGIMFRALSRAPVYLKLWLALLVSVLVIAPLFLLSHKPAQAMVLANALNLVGNVISSRAGLARILGLSHLFAWSTAVGMIVYAALGIQSVGIYEVWLLAAAVVGTVCLLIDASDVVRYALGDRGEMVPIAEVLPDR